ncbi:MAG: hypothetical protein KJO11_01215 [Gemmatimonadetes bacterium]|nr:hypothetical protein [Gemmatimonadota bacterium]NNF38709.1 hypothetical protein [Gemmatimonadota bacterium]
MDILIPIIAIISIFFVPITGLMLILVSRFALKPLVETLSQALRDSRGPDTAALLQIQGLMDQVEALTDEVRTLREFNDFDRALLGTPGDASQPSSAATASRNVAP